MVAASVVLPEQGSELTLPPGRRSVLVLARRLDASFLQAAEEGYRIRGLRLLPAGLPAPAVGLSLEAPDGRLLGCLTWLPERPGWKLVGSVMPWLSGAVLLFVAFTFVVMRSIQRAVAAIKFGETRFRDIAEASSDWIWETDALLRVEFVSERFAEITGLGREAVLGRTLAELLHPAEDLERWERHIADLVARRPFRGVLCRLDDAPPNHDRTLRIAGKPIFDAGGSFRGYRGTATDITAELEAQSEAWRMARHDLVTGLPNRLLIQERLAQAVVECRRATTMAAVLCLDLDRFKEINDGFGHAAGDLLIKACGERLAACLRETDTVARLGGDEFAIVQARIERIADVQRLADRLLACLHAPFQLDGHEVMVTASIGVAMVPMDGDRACCPAAQRRRRALSCQDRRPQPLPFLRVRHGRPAARAQGARGRSAACGAQRRARALLPAAARSAQRRDRGPRGAGTLEPPHPRPDAGRRLHSDRRGDRPARWRSANG